MLLVSTENPDQKIDILNSLVDLYINNSPEKAKEYAQKALDISNENNNTEGRVISLNILAKVEMNLANYKLAKQYIDEDFDLA